MLRVLDSLERIHEELPLSRAPKHIIFVCTSQSPLFYGLDKRKTAVCLPKKRKLPVLVMILVLHICFGFANNRTAPLPSLVGNHPFSVSFVHGSYGMPIA